MELVNKYNLLVRKENIFGDNIAYLEAYDFSKANMSNENRMKAITQIASICYQNQKAFGSESLYNRLAAESHSLPSSSFEFVPVLLDRQDFNKCYLSMTGNYPTINIHNNNPLTKFGEWIEDGKYLLTNFRAVVYLFETFGLDLRSRFNTEAECAIISKHFKVFKMKVDMPTFGQAVRHRINWQVLSRRYVSGARVPFDFYVADQMKDVKSYYSIDTEEAQLDTQDIIDICLAHYQAALDAGVKPQIARGIIPQCAYTVAWCAFQPKQFDSFITLRTDAHAQPEIRLLSNAMLELSSEPGGDA